MPKVTSSSLYRTEQRLKELQRLGLSPHVVRLAMFVDMPHGAFSLRCRDVGPPLDIWRKCQPAGPPVSYLWSCDEVMTGAWMRGGLAEFLRRPTCLSRRRLEFIKFKPWSPADGYVVIAHNEQGLFANRFSDMIGDADCHTGGTLGPEGLDWEEDFLRWAAEAADVGGIRYFEQVLAFRRTHAHRDDYGELLAKYSRSIEA